MPWEQLDLEIAEIFSAYSWHADDYQRALEIRIAEKNSVSAVRASWQGSKIYKAQRSEIQRRSREKNKPWRRPENREKAKEHQRKFRAKRTEEQRAAERLRVAKWRAENKERQREYMRGWRAKNAERVNEYQRARRSQRAA